MVLHPVCILAIHSRLEPAMATPTSDVDPSARLITPDGLPLAIIAISSIFFMLSVVTVALRTFIRIKKRIFGLEDTFMVIGTVCLSLRVCSLGYADMTSQIAYIPVTGLAIYGCLVGLGRMNEDLNAWQQSEAIKYYLIWILVYVVALATVKSSVCITIRRIASIKKPMRITVWVLLAVTWASFLVTFVGTLAYCQPVRSLCELGRFADCRSDKTNRYLQGLRR